MKTWPLWLWLSQISLPVVPLVYCVFRWQRQLPFRWWFWPLVFVCVSWIVCAATVALLPTGRTWLKSRRRELALASCAGILTLLVADLISTLTGFVPTLGQIRSQSLLYYPAAMTRHRLVPDRIVRRQNEADLGIDTRGFRGKGLLLPKPKGNIHVILLGGSQVFDFRGSDWPALVQERLSATGQSASVLNAGVPGHCTTDSLGKLVSDLWLVEPDLIVVCHSWNDIKYFAELQPRRTYRDLTGIYPGDWRTEPGGLDRLLCASAMYRLVRRGFWSTVYGGEGRLTSATGKVRPWGVRQFRLNVAAICDFGRSIGATVVLCKQARLVTAESTDVDRTRISYRTVGLPHDELVHAFQECDNAIDEISRIKNCPVIDMTPLNGRSDCFLDHIHFSKEGSKAAAEIVATALRGTLEERQSLSSD